MDAVVSFADATESLTSPKGVNVGAMDDFRVLVVKAGALTVLVGVDVNALALVDSIVPLLLDVDSLDTVVVAVVVT